MVNDDGASIDLSELDPTCMVVPTSEKAYSGVSRYKDFVRQLPVHLSKYILSWVDQVSLYNCVCVSRHWRLLVEEVHEEFHVNQRLWEEVMLMQVSVSSSFSSYFTISHTFISGQCTMTFVSMLLGHVLPQLSMRSALTLSNYSFNQRTVNEWNCVHSGSINMFKNRIVNYLVRAGYT